MKKYVWTVNLTVIAFLLSIVSAWAELNEAIMIDSIASICYIIVLSAFMYLDFRILKGLKSLEVNELGENKNENYSSLVKLKKSRLRKRSSRLLSFLLLLVAIVGMITLFTDANIILKNVFDVLFALGLMLKTIIDK